MKKVLYFFFFVLSLSSCGTDELVLNGVVDSPSLEGKTIYIKERIDREWKVLDSTVVSKGKFQFREKIDSSRIVYISYVFPAGNKVRQAFVYEAGKLDVRVDTTDFMTFKGTEQNDLLQQYQNQINDFNKESIALFKQAEDSVTGISDPQQLIKLEDERTNIELQINKKFATSHVNTLAGTFVFINSFYMMSVSEKEAIISMMNDKFKNVKRIKEIIEDIKIEKKTAVGQPYVDIQLASAGGEIIALSSLVGKSDYVLVDFWASWCGPCMHFVPELKEFYAKHHGSKFEILGVSLDDNRDDWQAAIAEKGMSWKQVSDLKGWKSEGARLYAVSSIPCTVLIDKSGKIAGRNLALSEIEKLLAINAPKK